MPFVALFVILLICYIISEISNCWDDYIFYKISPKWHAFALFVDGNFYLAMSILCFLLAVVYLVVFKPHKAQKYFIQYKNNDISRYQAITKIADTMYTPSSKIPSALNSKLMETRINALRKRVRAEESFINDLKSYIRSKES
jgi:hypothetical protein